MHVKRLKKHNASLVQSAREHKRTNAIPWGKLIYLSLVLIAIFKAGSGFTATPCSLKRRGTFLPKHPS